MASNRSGVRDPASPPYLLVTRTYPGNGLEIWLLLTDEMKYIQSSTEANALIIYASEIAAGRPIFLCDDEGMRQCGAVKASGS